MKNIVYVAQFHETCGYSHAALGYLRSLDSVLQTRPDIYGTRRGAARRWIVLLRRLAHINPLMVFLALRMQGKQTKMTTGGGRFLF